MYVNFHVKFLLLSGFNQNWNVSANFIKLPNMRVVQMKPVCGAASDDMAVCVTHQQSTMSCATEGMC
jgi:hypothetical protein